LQEVVIGEPEAASEEGPFVPGQAVDSALGCCNARQSNP
jgi:hypothetical protein